MNSDFLEGAVRVGVESLEAEGVLARAEDHERIQKWERASRRFELLFAMTAIVIIACGLELMAPALFSGGRHLPRFAAGNAIVGTAVGASGVIVFLLFMAYRSSVGRYSRSSSDRARH